MGKKDKIKVEKFKQLTDGMQYKSREERMKISYETLKIYRPSSIIMLEVIDEGTDNLGKYIVVRDAYLRERALHLGNIKKIEEFYVHGLVRPHRAEAVKHVDITEVYTGFAFHLLNKVLTKNGVVKNRPESETYKNDLLKWQYAMKFNIKAKIAQAGEIEFVNNKLVFYGNPNTQDTEITIPKIAQEVSNRTFVFNRNVIKVNYKSDASIPQSFAEHSSLQQINITGNVNDIGNNAFKQSDLESIDIPKSVSRIGYHAFSGCTNLKNVTFNGIVKYIGRYAFCNCYELESIVLPEGIEKINSYTFYDCSKLKSVWIPRSCKVIEDNAFKCDNSSETLVLYFPKNVLTSELRATLAMQRSEIFGKRNVAYRVY